MSDSEGNPIKFTAEDRAADETIRRLERELAEQKQATVDMRKHADWLAQQNEKLRAERDGWMKNYQDVSPKIVDIAQERDELRAKLAQAAFGAGAMTEAACRQRNRAVEIAGELAGALREVVAQFADMQGTGDIREVWHHTASEALAAYERWREEK